MATQRIIVVAFIFTALFHMASAIPGQATYYTTGLPPACLVNPSPGTLLAAAPPNIWNNGGACGSRFQIRCTGTTNQGVPQPCRGGQITVEIVDFCPGCEDNQFDLSLEAFAVIADPSSGRINIDFTRV